MTFAVLLPREVEGGGGWQAFAHSFKGRFSYRWVEGSGGEGG